MFFIVGLYLLDSLDFKFKIRPDLAINELTESLFIQVTNSRHKDVIVGVIYKPPNIDVEQFNDNLEHLLKTLTKERRPCYLLGDYNINLLKQDKHLPTKRFIDTILAYGFYPLINKPTRITSQSITLIDNILTNVHNL